MAFDIQFKLIYQGIRDVFRVRSLSHKKDILQEYRDLEAAAIPYQEFLSYYNFDYLLTEKGNLLYTYLKEDPDYELVLEYDGKSFGQDSSVRLYKPITK